MLLMCLCTIPEMCNVGLQITIYIFTYSGLQEDRNITGPHNQSQYGDEESPYLPLPSIIFQLAVL